ncbi:MAG: response regulator [Pseudomonadota bacterium]
MTTFLIVDDSTVLRKVARRILEGFGCVCDEAENGELGLKTCAASMPDAILLDWNMPVMNGLDFLIALRARPGGNVPVVIFCTTESDQEHVRAAMQAGANAYIFKPFDADIIQSKMEFLALMPGHKA